jgi:hypothetical protein
VGSTAKIINASQILGYHKLHCSSTTAGMGRSREGVVCCAYFSIPTLATKNLRAPLDKKQQVMIDSLAA